MFIRSNRASFHFHLWWNKNLLKHQKVSKYYESSCMPPIKTLAQVLSAPSLRQRKITHSLGSVFSKICFPSAGEIKEQTMVWFTDLTLTRPGFFKIVFPWGHPLPLPLHISRTIYQYLCTIVKQSIWILLKVQKCWDHLL